MNLSYNGFDTDGGKALADVIKNNSSLQELNISSTRLTAESAASIANALQVNDSLKTLIVSQFSLKFERFWSKNFLNLKKKDVK